MKRNAICTNENAKSEKKAKAAAILGYVAHTHPNFYPSGAVINLFVLASRYSQTDITSVEIFAIEPLFWLILDYLGPQTKWIVSYVQREHVDRDPEPSHALVSLHQTRCPFVLLLLRLQTPRNSCLLFLFRRSLFDSNVLFEYK
jgi:hypothetical protein